MWVYPLKNDPNLGIELTTHGDMVFFLQNEDLTNNHNSYGSVSSKNMAPCAEWPEWIAVGMWITTCFLLVEFTRGILVFFKAEALKKHDPFASDKTFIVFAHFKMW